MSSTAKYTLLFAAAFLAMHGLSLFSFFVEPLRPVLFFILLGAAAVFAFAKPEYAVVPIVLELLLDSSGHLFEWRGLSLRLLTLGVALIAWLYHAIRARQLITKLKTPFTLLYVVILAIVAVATYNGYLNGHGVKLIIADTIPFLYLALWYPMQDFYLEMLKRVQHDNTQTLILGSFLGAVILSLITLFLFSSGLQEIHGPFYTWWRDWVAGKATSTGFGFYRIVTSLHLFLTALVPFVMLNLFQHLQLWRSRNKFGMTLLVFLAPAILLVPTINFSRIYFLAIIPATLIMAWKLPWKKVLLTLVLIGAISLAEYSVINLAASRGQSLGFEFITKQSRGIIDPESEASASARAAILPHLLQKIKNRPFVGEGLGATVTYYNPFLKKELTTPHLDWGYLELAVEFGIVAAAFFAGLLLWLFWRSRKEPLIASILTFLLVITLTTPAIFHVYGISLILAVLYRHTLQSLDKGLLL